jgi:hypothetical protein
VAWFYLVFQKVSLVQKWVNYDDVALGTAKQISRIPLLYYDNKRALRPMKSIENSVQ